MTGLFLADEERRTVLQTWNDTEFYHPVDSRVHLLVAEWAQKQPDAVAVVAEDATLTYAELDGRANQLANHLISLGVRQNQRVVILLDRVAVLPVAVLAVLKTGAAYVPLDVEQAGSRVGSVLADGDVAALITRGSIGSAPPGGVAVVDLDEDAVFGGAPTAPEVAVAADSPACVVYTSGSTGRPKGVQISHGNLAGMYHGWEHAYRLAELRAHCQMLNFSFVVFQADLIRALCSGARLVLCPLQTVLDPKLLHRTIVDHGVDVAEFVPSVLRRLVTHLRETGSRLESMKLLVVGSDRWLYGEHTGLREVVGPDTRLVHSFGLTETTVDSAYFEGTDVALSEGQLTPIGRPFPNVRLYILDPDGDPVGVGVLGELHVGGVGVTLGYLNDAERTAERFVPDPFTGHGRLYRTGDLAKYLKDGNIAFVGRRDAQVKIRGFRVELGEVEAGLRAHPGVRDAVVVPVSDDSGETQLACYVVPARHAVAGEAGFRLLKLPDGREVASVNDSETFQFHQEITVDELYFRHGVDVRPGDVVFDVGANVGMFSLAAHARATEIEVYAFEPGPDVFQALSFNLALYGVNARAFQCGLSDRADERTLSFYRSSAGMSSFYPDADEEKAVLGAIMRNQFAAAAESDTGSYVDEWLSDHLVAEPFSCELRTVSDVVADVGVERIDLLKVVVQKSEWDVLRGIADTDWPRIGQLVIEVYDLAGRVAEMRSYLENKGYRVAVEQAPLFAGSMVHLMYAVRPDHRAGRAGTAADVRQVAAPAVSAKVLHDHLRARLSEYMVPRRYAFLAALPVTTTGKVDRLSLPADELVDLSGTADYVEPRTDTERRVAEIWGEVLGVRQVGAQDDFFALGGHSLRATQVLSRVREVLGAELPLRLFLRARTVEALAAEVDKLVAGDTPTPAAGAITRADRSRYRVSGSGA